MQLRTPNAPASRKQLWLLHILTKEDTREWKLTMQEASDKITELKGNGNKPKTKAKDWLSILRQADAAAKQAFDDFTKEHYTQPWYEVQQHSNPLDDKSPVTKRYPLQDLCGFVWLELKLKGNEHFINEVKRIGKLDTGKWGDRREWLLGEFRLVYRKGVSKWSYPWEIYAPHVGYGNGSISAAEAAGHAFCKAMKVHDVDIWCRSRLD